MQRSNQIHAACCCTIAWSALPLVKIESVSVLVKPQRANGRQGEHSQTDCPPVCYVNGWIQSWSMVDSGMQEPVSDEVGLVEALAVAKNGAMLPTSEGDAKMLAFFLREGECTAEISESKFSVWYSWLPRPLPSTYIKSLAPGLVRRLMQLGNVKCITDEETFRCVAQQCSQPCPQKATC